MVSPPCKFGEPVPRRTVEGATMGRGGPLFALPHSAYDRTARASSRISDALHGFAMKIVPSGRRLMRGGTDSFYPCHSAGGFHVCDDYRKAPARLVQHMNCCLGAVALNHVHFVLFEQPACARSLHFIVFHD